MIGCRASEHLSVICGSAVYLRLRIGKIGDTLTVLVVGIIGLSFWSFCYILNSKLLSKKELVPNATFRAFETTTFVIKNGANSNTVKCV